MKRTILIIRTLIATGAVLIYFKKRKLYVDDKYFQIKVWPKKDVKIYRKDILNIIGIISSSTLFVSIGEKVYFFVKEHDIMLTISKKDFSSIDAIDGDAISLPDAVDIISSPDPGDVLPSIEKNEFQSKKKFPTRDIVWIAVALAITYYLGQRIDRIDNLPVSKLSMKEPGSTTRTTTQLNWWERRGLEDWMIKDISDEGTYGQITRPTLPGDIEPEPIANSRPRRIVVILFTILNRMPNPTDEKKIPVWVISPLFSALQFIYRRINK